MNRKKKWKKGNNKGFSLVELVVAIIIILVLSAIVVPNVITYVQDASRSNAKTKAATILSQLQADYAAHLSGGVVKNSNTVDEKGNFTINGEFVEKNGTLKDNVGAYYKLTNRVITEFGYGDGEFVYIWKAVPDSGTDNWTYYEVEPEDGDKK